MERKYELLTDQTKEFHNGTVYRIQALKDINDYIKKVILEDGYHPRIIFLMMEHVGLITMQLFVKRHV